MATMVNSKSVKQSGGEIITNANTMYQKLSRIQELVKQSSDGFDSEAGNKIRSQFNSSAEKFRDFEAFLKTYGEFLQNFAGNVVSYEQSVEEAAAQIPQL